MRSRTATALTGLLVSLVITLAAWYYFDTLLVFLLLPFVPILFRGRGDDSRGLDVREDRTVRKCPQCGFQTRNPEFSHCPRDGSRLQER